jgi:hypothetical protein
MSAGSQGRGIFEVEGLFETVLADLRAGREALVSLLFLLGRVRRRKLIGFMQGWAEQQMEMEKGVLRERLLKG